MDKVCIVGEENISKPKRIDYTHVTSVLETMKEDAISWLRKVICST